MIKMKERLDLQDEHENPEETVDYFYDLYMDDVKLRCKLSTIRMKQNIFETKVLPFFGSMRVCDVTPKLIRKWQVGLSDPEFGLSSSYLHYINAQFSAFMEYVKEICDLPMNPFEKVRNMGSVKARCTKYWTPKEYFAFRDATKVEPLAYICFETLFWTGIQCSRSVSQTRPQ